MGILKECGLRSDGRFPMQIRNVLVTTSECQVDVLHGGTAVTSTLEWNTHRTGKKKDIDFEVIFFISSYETVLKRDKKGEEYSFYLESIFSQVYAGKKKAGFEVKHRIKQDGGSLLSVLINSTTILLAKNGVPIYFPVFGVTCGFISCEKDEIIIDLTRNEEREGIPMITCALKNGGDEILFSLLENGANYEEFPRFISAVSGCLNYASGEYIRVLRNSEDSILRIPPLNR